MAGKDNYRGIKGALFYQSNSEHKIRLWSTKKQSLCTQRSQVHVPVPNAFLKIGY